MTTPSSTSFNDKDFQKIIANVLRYGVWIALSIALIGGVLLLFQDSNKIVDFQFFTENDHNILVVFQNSIQGVLQGQGEAIVFLGIFFLFLTPVMRILLSLFSFYKEKDLLYVIITLLVILIILLSLSFGFSH